MDYKHGKAVSYCDGFPSIRSLNPFNTRSLEIILQIKNIATAAMPRATKLGQWVIYHEKLPLIMLHDHLIMFPYKITWQI